MRLTTLAPIALVLSFAVGFAVCFALGACDGAQDTNPCPRGICTGGDGGAADLSGAPCVEAWNCTPWTTQNGMGVRQCFDANNCGTTTNEPPTGPLPLPALDLDYYKCKVEPIFDRGCAMLGCHGTDTGRAFRVYARGRFRNQEQVPPLSSCLETMPVDLQTAGSATIMCHGWTAHTDAEWQKNFDGARSFMLGITNPDDSDLLQQPVVGGKSHEGVHLFKSTDPDYLTIRAWLAGATLGQTCVPNN